MTKRSHQHYMPQFYLRGFVDPACPSGHEPYVWVYDRGSVVPCKRAPKNIATELHFYSMTEEDGTKNAKVEEWLSVLESETALLWKKLGNPKLTLSRDERQVVAEFVACMSRRVPAVRAQRNIVVNEISRMILKMGAAHYDELKERHPELMQPSRAELVQAANDESLRFEASQGMHIRSMLNLVERVTPVIQTMNWAFLHAPAEYSFITSDQPVVLVNPQAPPGGGSAGFAVAGVEVTLPVNGRICMLLTWDGPAERVDIDRDQTRRVNLRTAGAAYEQAFAPTELLWLSDLFSRSEHR